MLIRRILFVVPLLLIAALSGQENQPKPRAESRFGSHLPPAAIAAMQSIRADNIETHVRFLSHDLLEGRGTGQRGGDIAAEYIAAQFALYGLKPAGDNASYFPKVPMVGVTPGGDPPLHDPKFFADKALTYYGRWTYKYEEAARKGAVGAILIHKTEMASYPWEVVRNSNSGEKSYLKLDDAPKLKAAAWIQSEVAHNLFAASGLDLDKMMADANSRDFKPVPLQVRLLAHMTSKVRPFESNNVIAVLPGADSVLKGEGVMYTAHYDHLGIRPDMPGDNIYNGAVDNATGCGILMEIARVYAGATERPRRSIYFVSVTAEEQGLLGSEYLGKHPPIAAGKISLDLNYDAVKPLGAAEEVEVSGAQRTTFYSAVQAAAQDFRFKIRPDAHPEAGHYYRSDHFSLARVGIPSFSINEGMKFKGRDEAWGLAQDADYTAHHYTQPSDEYHPGMDYTSDAAMARFGFVLGWEAAGQARLVGWKKGDEFEGARLTSQ